MSTEIYRDREPATFPDETEAGESSDGLWRRRVVAVVQIALAAGLLFLALRNVEWSKVQRQLIQADWMFVVLAVACNVVMTILMGCRLGVLARTVSAAISYREIVSAQFKAALVNGFVPGSLGGDAVRFYALERTVRDKASVLAVLVVERLIGTWGVFLTASAALFLDHHFLDTRQWIVALVFALSGVVGITVVLFSQSLEDSVLKILIPVWRAFSSVRGAGYVGGIFKRLLAAVRRFRNAQGRVWAALTLSIAVRCVWVFGIYLLALALGLNLSLALLFGLISFVDIARMLPVAPPNGIGVREAMLVYFLALVGVGRESALGFSLLIYGVMTVNALLGGALAMARGMAKLRS